MLFLLLSLPFVTSHIIENKVLYPIVINGGEECIFRPLEPEAEIDVRIEPGTVVTIQNTYGMVLGNFRVWDEVHTRTVIDSLFMRSQHCEDIDNTDRCVKEDCIRGKGWTMVQCAQTCDSCHLLNTAVRCNTTAIKSSNYDGMRSGFQDKTKRRIMINFQNLKPEVISENPLLIHFDNFMDDEDVDELLEYAQKVGLKRSTGQGEIDENGVQEQSIVTGRTSENTWCMGSCRELSSMKRVVKRVSMMTSLSDNHFESAQILRYTQGQKYDSHNDIGDKDFSSLAGPRIFTFFVYLSDVENGGETEFPRLKLKFKPKKGSAVFWSSVKEVNGQFFRDDMTIHQANPPGQGELKFAMNVWVHSKDFSTPNTWGCTARIFL